MSVSACNALQNPSFESGVAPWKGSAANVASLQNSTSYFGKPFDGSNYLSVQTAIDNQGNSISQGIKNLKPSVEYTFSAEVQVPEGAASYCFITSYLGHNITGPGKINTLEIDMQNTAKWINLNGTVTPKASHGILSIFGYCSLEDPSYTTNWLIDAISFAPTQC